MKHPALFIVMISIVPMLTSCKEKRFSEVRELKFEKASKSIGFANYVIPEEEAKKMMKNFRAKFRGCDDESPGLGCGSEINMNDSLSKSVWMSREAMLNLFLQFLVEPKLDGLRFYVGAYEEKDPQHIPGNCYKDQVSIIIVPTRKAEIINPKLSPHHDDWKYFQDYLRKYIKNSMILEGGFNHGELCPDKCPSGE